MCVVIETLMQEGIHVVEVTRNAEIFFRDHACFTERQTNDPFPTVVRELICSPHNSKDYEGLRTLTDDKVVTSVKRMLEVIKLYSLVEKTGVENTFYVRLPEGEDVYAIWWSYLSGKKSGWRLNAAKVSDHDSWDTEPDGFPKVCRIFTPG